MLQVPDDILGVVDWRMQVLVRLVPLPVQVTAEQGASIVAVDDSIRVEHGHNPEYEMASQLFSFGREQVSDKAVDHVRGLRLSRMHSACDDHSLLLAMILYIIDKPLPKSLKERTGLNEVIFIVLKELPQLFLHCSVQQSLDLPSGLLTLLRKLLRVVVLLLEGLFHDSSKQGLQAELLVVVQVGIYVLSYGEQRHWSLGQALAEHVHPQEGLVLWCLPQLEQVLLQLSIGRGYGVRKPDIIVLVGCERILEAQGEVGIYALACPIVIVEKGVIVVLVSLHFLVVASEVSLSNDVVLGIGDFLASAKPSNAFSLKPSS